MLTRRTLIHASAAMWAGAAAARVPGGGPTVTLAAAWDDSAGRHHVGVLEVVQPPGAAASRLRVRHALPVPTRAHAVTPLPDGSIVAVARRPGAWLLRWRPGSAAPARWQWSEPDRSFNGHVLADRKRALLCTETDASDGSGLLVRRDAVTLAVTDEWPTGGIDPHAVLALPEGGWLVANGGVPVVPESGRVKGNLATMDSSLVRLNAGGEIQAAWRLADRRLSLRHLARHDSGVVGVALQAEHDDDAERRRAPLLAVWDGQRLLSGSSEALEGYAGDIVARSFGFLVGATRAACVAQFNLQGQCVVRHPLPQACALAPWSAQGWLAGGAPAGRISRDPGLPTRDMHASDLSVDNHWVRIDT